MESWEDIEFLNDLDEAFAEDWDLDANAKDLAMTEMYGANWPGRAAFAAKYGLTGPDQIDDVDAAEAASPSDRGVPG
jgi:hypothetical protein